MRLALVLLAGAAVAFAATTWWALESSGVGTLETRAADGALRSTRVWYAEPDGELWLEAGSPESPWLVDVEGDSRVAFTAEGHAGRYEARVVAGAPGHERIRALLEEKYGLRDCWVGLLVDTSRSVAVALTRPPASAGQ